jgi:hypothetical protein
MALWDQLLTDQTKQREDPGIVPLYQPPSDERQVTELEKMTAATQQQTATLNALIQQNQQATQAQQQTNQALMQLGNMLQSQRQPVQEQPVPEPWAAILNKTTDSKKPTIPSPDDIAKLVDQRVAQGFQAHQQTYTELQQTTQYLDNHFRQNYPQWANDPATYDLVKEQFAIHAKANNGNLVDAYTQAVNWANRALPKMPKGAAPRPTPAPYGNGSADEWMPGMSRANQKEQVASVGGNKYTIDKYYKGVLPMVEETEDHQRRDVERYEAFKMDRILAMQGRIPRKEYLAANPELELVS